MRTYSHASPGPAQNLALLEPLERSAPYMRSGIVPVAHHRPRR